MERSESGARDGDTRPESGQLLDVEDVVVEGVGEREGRDREIHAAEADRGESDDHRDDRADHDGEQ